jgi:uncharacterized protein YndB with AHSA1/START domain
MTKINRSIDIDAAPQRVFEELSHWDGLARWSTITSSHTGPARCNDVGDEFDQTLRVAGVELQTHWRVTEYDPPHLIAYHATGPGQSSMDMRQTVTDAGDGSTVEIDIDYDLPGGVLGEAVDQLYAERRNEREAEHTLENLKQLLEGQPT